MASAHLPLTRDRIVVAAEEVLRKYGPAKATVVDVARALGVSHAAVYQHVRTKAELRALVIRRWVDETMPPLRAIAARPGPAPKRLRELYDTLIAFKRRRAAAEPELFLPSRTLVAEAQSVVAGHLDDLIEVTAAVIRAGVQDGSFRPVDPMAAGRAVLLATFPFHHPAHIAEWSEPKYATAYDAVWDLLLHGLAAAPNPARAPKKRR